MTHPILPQFPRRRRRHEEARPTLELPLDPPRPVEREIGRPARDDHGRRGVADVDFYI